MTGKLNYFVDGQVLKIQTEGDYTVEEALNSPATPEKIAIIIDSSHANINRTKEDFNRIIESFVAHADRITCFAYVTLSDNLFEIVQQAASFAEFSELGSVKPFRDIESTENWIEKQLNN